MKFYKIKESEKGPKKNKEKQMNSASQFWSIFILLIMNEYNIGRHIDENNKELIDSISAAEISEIPRDKLENYVN